MGAHAKPQVLQAEALMAELKEDRAKSRAYDAAVVMFEKRGDMKAVALLRDLLNETRAGGGGS